MDPHSSARRRALAAALIAVAAIATRFGATADWGSGRMADGARVSISPIGLTRSIPGSTGHSCRWWPRGVGDPGLCALAPDGGIAFSRLRAAYPLLTVALWLAVISLFLQVLRIPRGPVIRVAVTWSVTLLSAGAVMVVLRDAPRAMAVLVGRPASYGAAGFWLACTAFVCSLVSGVLQLRRGEPGA